jgi:hypothetical protein
MGQHIGGRPSHFHLNIFFYCYFRCLYFSSRENDYKGGALPPEAAGPIDNRSNIRVAGEYANSATSVAQRDVIITAAS